MFEVYLSRTSYYCLGSIIGRFGLIAMLGCSFV